MIYLRINIDLCFTTPVSGAVRSKINKVKNSIDILLPDAKKINNGQPNEENTILATWGIETIGGIEYQHVVVEIALPYPLTQPQQDEFDALRPLVQDIVIEAANPVGEPPLFQKRADFHICTHEPPVQSCTGVTNL